MHIEKNERAYSGENRKYRAKGSSDREISQPSKEKTGPIVQYNRRMTLKAIQKPSRLSLPSENKKAPGCYREQCPGKL